MDQREYVDDWEETLRTVFSGLMAGHYHAMPGRVTQASADGHTVQVQATIRRVVTDPVSGERTFEDHPPHLDVPVKFASGGGITHTFPLDEGLEGLILYANRDHNAWHQSGGTQAPVTDRMHGYADPIFIPGLRSDPRKLAAVSTTSSQIRSDDGHHVTDHDPAKGVTHFSADPSTPPASETFDPFQSATRFISHIVQGAKGLIGSAVDGSTVHSHGVDHDQGGWMSAMTSAGLNVVRAHPVLGSILSALGGQHSVTAGLGGIAIQSATSISLACPPGGLELPAGSIGGASLSAGAAASNVGALAGDLSGSLPAPNVVGLGHVDAHLLPTATSDAAAAAAGVAIGGLYRDTSIASGKSVLVVRMA